MKKVILILAVMSCVTACNSSQNEEVAVNADTLSVVTNSVVADSAVVDTTAVDTVKAVK